MRYPVKNFYFKKIKSLLRIMAFNFFLFISLRHVKMKVLSSVTAWKISCLHCVYLKRFHFYKCPNQSVQI